MNQDLKFLARKNRKNPTKAEGLFWNMVVRRKLTNYRFVKQKVLGNFIIDFYCPKLKLAVELDGSSHENKEDFDMERMRKLESTGIKFIRYENELVEKKLEGVYYHLLEQLKERENKLRKL